MLDAIDKIKRYTANMDFEQYQSESMVIDSVNMNLSIIGEAARNIPDEVQDQYPAIDWRNVAGLRNIITHEYFRLNLARIWDVVENNLPELETQIRAIIDAESETDANDE